MSAQKCEELLWRMIEEDFPVGGLVGFSHYIKGAVKSGVRGALLLSLDSGAAHAILKKACGVVDAGGVLRFEEVEPLLGALAFLEVGELARKFQGNEEWRDAEFEAEVMRYDVRKEFLFLRLWLGGTGATLAWDAMGITAEEARTRLLLVLSGNIRAGTAEPASSVDVLLAMQQCGGGCGNERPANTCSRCECLRYCSRECQVSAYPEHKKVCKKLAPLLAEYRQEARGEQEDDL